MNDRIHEIMEELRKELIANTSDLVVSVDIHLNCQGISFTVSERSPEGLERDGISRRNLKGEFIREGD